MSRLVRRSPVSARAPRGKEGQRRSWRVICLLSIATLLTLGAASSHATTALVPLRVVVLGDSYSAGNGAGDYYGPHGCFRSHSNWAEQYVAWLRTQGYAATLTNRACSGSTSEHIYRERIDDGLDKYYAAQVSGIWNATDPGLPDALRAVGYCTSNSSEVTYTFTITRTSTTIFNTTLVDFACNRHLEAQMLGVGKDTDLVLMTIGGNDLGFGSIVRKCYWGGAFGERNEADCSGLIDGAQRSVDDGTLTSKIRTALSVLRQRLRPDARIALNAYPYVDSASPSYTLGSYPVSAKMRTLESTGDVAEQAAVNQDNADAGRTQTIFVPDIKQCFAGHEPYGAWDDENPNRWIWEFERGPYGPFFFVGDRYEIYHPNPTGQTQWANCLHPYGSFGTSGTLASDVDVVFVVDTTGSMGDDIDAVKSFAAQFVDELRQSTSSYRFALVTYRDQPSWTGDPSDYASRVDLNFTDDTFSIVSAIDSLQVGGGGDYPESVYSGLITGMYLDWRPNVQKVVIQLGDAPPHDPEPVSGFTLTDVVNTAFSVDPAQVYVVDVSGAGAAGPELTQIAQQTGGNVFSATSSSEVAQALTAAINKAVTKPSPWTGGPYVATIGTPITLDATGSFDPDGTIVSYEWDVNGDGTYDTTSSQPTYSYTYTAAFSGTIGLRVTDNDGNQSVATTNLDASADGDGIAAPADNCPTVSNHGQSDFDQDGIGDACDSTPWGQAAARRPVIAAGQGHSLALLADGTVKAWGLGSSGQLGRGSKISSTTPVSVTGLNNVSAIAAGQVFSVALRSDGTVWTWGDNGDGQLGDGTKTGRLSPAQVTGLPTITAIAAGGSHTLALASDGTVWAWGDNSFGQIGNGNTTDQTRPVHVPNVTGVVAVAGGGYHTLALKSDGTVIGWGDNANGQLGTGSRVTNQLTPVRAGSLTNVAAIAAGFQHSLAATSDGNTWSWGNNASGQLCDGTTADRLSPVQISSLGSTRAVAAGQNYSLVLQADGSAKACGNNAQGQLGDGTTTGRSSPVSVLGLAGATAIATSWQHSLAVLGDGTDRGWGYNKYGQLGDGSNTDRRSPVNVTGITTNAEP